MNLKQEVKQRKKEMLDTCSGGSSAHPDQKEQIKTYNLLDWCLSHLLDQYLDANENTIKSAVRKDSPIPQEIIKLLIEQEKSKLNRPAIIKFLEARIEPEIKPEPRPKSQNRTPFGDQNKSVLISQFKKGSLI